MSSILMLEAIGYLDEELLGRSEKQQRKRKAWIGWVALAACACLICVGAWGIVNPVKSNDSAEAVTEYPVDTKPALDMEDPGEKETHFQNSVSDILTDDLAAYFVQTGNLAENNYALPTVITSRKQLEEYVDENDGDLSDMYRKYDDAFFEEKELIVLPLEGNSGSVSHELLDISKEEREWTVWIQRFYPTQLTKDLEYWCVLIELDAGTIHENDPISVEYLDVSEDD